ncbi:MAG: acyl-CoA dehydrogenase family protein, partial [Bacteroidales bacterium]|nr:acyl-CoA dehydrogenase family protein [Bacteroidales bacterium]
MYVTEEHEMIRKTVRDFAEREIRPVAQELDEKGQFSLELTKRMGELGLFGLITETKYGGSNMDMLAYVIATEELARIDGS